MMLAKSQQTIRKTITGADKNFELITHNAGRVTLSSPEEAIGPLIRDYHVIRYCISGHGAIRLNSKNYFVSPGQCYVCLEGDVLTESAAEGDPWTLAYITLMGIKAPMYLKLMGITAKTPFFPWAENQEILAYIEKAMIICGSLPKPDTEFSRMAVAYTLFDLLQNHLLAGSSAATAEGDIQEQYINEALRYMELNCAGPLTVSDVASHIGINRSYFYSLFKQYTGQSPQEHLTRLRVTKGCELFAYPHATAVNVANSVGLKYPVFYLHFKRIMGMTPSEYRDRLLKKKQ